MSFLLQLVPDKHSFASKYSSRIECASCAWVRRRLTRREKQNSRKGLRLTLNNIRQKQLQASTIRIGVLTWPIPTQKQLRSKAQQSQISKCVLFPTVSPVSMLSVTLRISSTLHQSVYPASVLILHPEKIHNMMCRCPRMGQRKY